MIERHWAILIFLGLILVQTFPTRLRASTIPQSNSNLVAVVIRRIETDRLEIRVYQRKKLVQLIPFTEMLIIRPVLGRAEAIENLANKSVAIVRSEKNPDRWEVYQDVWAGTGGESLTLADNVFKVRQVLVASEQNPLQLRLDEKVVRLNPGDALLVL